MSRKAAEDFGLSEHEVFAIHYAMGQARFAKFGDHRPQPAQTDEQALVVEARAALHRIGLLVDP